MVRDLRKMVTKEGKEYWTFHIVAEIMGQAVDLAGWKYFTDSGTVRPPQFNIAGKYVSMVLGLNKPLEERIAGAVRRALGSDLTSEAPASTPGVVEEAPFERPSWLRTPEELRNEKR